jgi:heme-degrading monooxygenase HmoA
MKSKETISSNFAKTPAPPYYAVIFTATRTAEDKGYSQMAEHMETLAKQQPGFLGIESVENNGGFEITVSYWDSEESIRAWKAQMEHQVAQKQGRKLWYEHYEIRIAKVDRAYNTQTSTLQFAELR